MAIPKKKVPYILKTQSKLIKSKLKNGITISKVYKIVKFIVVHNKNFYFGVSEGSISKAFQNEKDNGLKNKEHVSELHPYMAYGLLQSCL